MKVFVTGGTGFVGGEVIKRLVAGGHLVKALTRSAYGASALRSLGAEPVSGDLVWLDKWQDSLAGSDVVVHCAAPVEFWGPWQKFEREIVLATKNLALAASRAGVKRFVHISSESALQDRDSLLGVDEQHPYPDKPNSVYGAAKKLAELELLNINNSMEIVILRSPFVWGVGSNALKKIAARAMSGSFMWVGGGNSMFEAIHVRNLAEAVFLAASKGKGIYWVTDDAPTSVRDFFTEYLKMMKIRIPQKNIPGIVVEKLAVLVEMLWHALGITKKAPPLSRFEWAFVAMPRSYDISKIKRDLGYKPVVSWQQGMAEF